MNPDCKTIDPLLADAAADRLAEIEQQHVERHLPSCTSCQTSLQRLRLLRSDLKSPMPSAPVWFTSNVLYQVRRRKEGRYRSQKPRVAIWTGVTCATALAMVFLSDKQFTTRLLPRMNLVSIETQNAKRGFEITGPAASLKIAHQVSPEYSESARQQNLTGVIEIYFMTDTEGAVDPNLRVVKTTGHKVLDQSALHALQQWKFVPNAPNKTDWGVITFHFPPSF